MSLISEALKKAQRMRTSEPAGGSAPATGGGNGSGPAMRRSPGQPVQSLVWIIAGAAVVVCAAVVTTVFLVRPAPPALSLAKAAPAPPAANTASATPGPLLVPPVVSTPPKSADASVLKTEPAVPPGSEAAVPPPKIPASAPSTARPAGPPSRLPPAVGSAAGPDPRIQTFVDAIKVAGIRSSGTDSKVLMNDHVYRVNDIVDRSLNLRLIEVQSDTLTFTDENHVVYSKSF